MHVHDAQREVRSVYLCGSVGQFVSGAVWMLSAAVSTGISHRAGMLALFFGGAFIFPVTTMILKLMGGKAALSAENPLGALAMQVAFTVPLGFPLVVGATLYREDWFYPAAMVLVGAHYLPFTFLYGMRQFIALAAALMAGGFWLGVGMRAGFTAGGWLGGVVLVAFAAAFLAIAQREEREGAPGAR